MLFYRLLGSWCALMRLRRIEDSSFTHVYFELSLLWGFAALLSCAFLSSRVVYYWSSGLSRGGSVYGATWCSLVEITYKSHCH